MQNIIRIFGNGDKRLFILMNRKIKCIPLDISMPFITQLGSLVFAVFLPLLLMFSGRSELRLMGYHMALVLIISQLIVHLVKRLVNRPRPFISIDNVIARCLPSCKYSFPSGHSCAAFSLALVLAHGMPTWANLFYGLASMVAVSRVYLGVHYPSDVLVGYIMAYASFIINFAVI